MKAMPATLALVPVAVVLAATLVYCPPEPDAPAVEASPETAALAVPLPEVAVLRGLAKDRIAREVAAGRRPLVEAVALFAALDRVPPEAVESSRLDRTDAA